MGKREGGFWAHLPSHKDAGPCEGSDAMHDLDAEPLVDSQKPQAKQDLLTEQLGSFSFPLTDTHGSGLL